MSALLVERLKRSNDELAQFAHIASHDLQAPIRMITSFLVLLEERHAEKLDSEGREFIAYALEGAGRMQALIEGLLSYSRVGTQGTNFERLDLNDVVGDVIVDLHADITASDTRVCVGALPSVLGERAQMRQLLQNLIENAIKFRSADAPRIELSGEEREGEWLLCVADNGIGIEPGGEERIFDLFGRLHGVSEYPGSGLGLSVCKRIVEHHGGRIWAEGRPGGGSVFLFTLPRAPAVAPRALRAAGSRTLRV